MADEEYTEEDKKRTYLELATFISTEMWGLEESTKECIEKYKSWTVMRTETIDLISETAESIKSLNDDTTPAQILCKAESAVAKLSIFGGPVPVAIGAATSVAVDAASSYLSKLKIDELEKLCTKVEGALENDNEKTADFFTVMNEIRRISDKVKKCINKFHSATIKGFFDNVPSLRCFVRTIKDIPDINNPKALFAFLLALREDAECLVDDPSLTSSLFSLLTFNPGVLELTLTIPSIVLNLGIIGFGAGSGMAGNIVGGLNALSIAADIVDIVAKIRNYDKYPQLAMELIAIKKKLQEEMDNVSEMAQKL